MTLFLVAGLVFAAGLFIHEHHRAKLLAAEAAAAKERVAEIEKENRGLDIRLKMLSKMNAELEEKSQAIEKEKVAVLEKLKQSEARLKEIQGQVEVMSPDEMVQETRRILKDSGIEKIDVGARFSLSAFRKNTGILKEWEEFSLAKIPALEEISQVQEKEILNLQNQVFLWKESDRLWRQKNTLWLEEKTSLNALLNNYQKQINSQKRQKIWTLLLGLAAGFGIHALVGK